MRRKQIRLAVLLAVLWTSRPNCVAASGPADELKSAAVWGFLRYSEWPASPDGSITVGVLGRRSFYQALRRILADKSVNHRPVRVVELKTDLHRCQLIYFATDRISEISPALERARSLRALTIGEGGRFLENGGAVSLFLADGHIAFQASLEAIERSGVAVSSNMLRLGEIRARGKGGMPK
jgi:hypothetical protein